MEIGYKKLIKNMCYNLAGKMCLYIFAVIKNERQMTTFSDLPITVLLPEKKAKVVVVSNL